MGRLAGFSYRQIDPALNRYTTIPNHAGDMPEGTLRAILKLGVRLRKPGSSGVLAAQPNPFSRLTSSSLRGVLSGLVSSKTISSW